jgi:hypothetical protein
MNRYQYIARLSEPSTWAGISILLGLLGINFAPDQAQTFIQGGTGLAAALSIFIPEKGK